MSEAWLECQLVYPCYYVVLVVLFKLSRSIALFVNIVVVVVFWFDDGRLTGLTRGGKSTINLYHYSVLTTNT